MKFTRPLSMLVGSVLAATLSGIATPASADETQCRPGYTKVTLSSVHTPWKITHAHVHSLGKGATRKITRRADWNMTLRAHMRVTSSAGASISAKIKRLARVRVGATINGTAAYWAAHTRTESIKVTDTIRATKRRTRWVAFQGNHSSKGYWTAYHCSSDGKRMVRGKSGRYASFKNVPISGIIRCSGRWAASSPEAKAINVACP